MSQMPGRWAEEPREGDEHIEDISTDPQPGSSAEPSTQTRRTSLCSRAQELRDAVLALALQRAVRSDDTQIYTCCGDAQYSYTSSTRCGSWTGTHDNQNPYHFLHIMATARHNATEISPLSPLPTPPSQAAEHDYLPPTNVWVGRAASQNFSRPQNRRLSSAFSRVRRESLQPQSPGSSDRLPNGEILEPQSPSSSITSRPELPSRAVTESQHTRNQVVRATMFTMQYYLNQTPQGAFLMMTHQRPEEVDFALDALETSPELRYLADLKETEAIVWAFIGGSDVSHLL